MFSGAWLSTDKLLLSGRLAASTASPSGGALEPMAGTYPWPQMLPDGKHLLYTVWNARRGLGHLARVERVGDPGSAKDLIETDSRVMYTASVASGAGFLVYLRAGSLLAQPFDARSLRVTGEAKPVVDKVYWFAPTGAADFSVSDRGSLAYMDYDARSQLAWVDRRGRRLAVVGPERTNVKSGRLSPDGRWVAAAIYDVERGSQSLWLFNTKTGAGRQLTPAPGLRDAPVWSADSSKLAYLHATGDALPRIHARGIGEDEAEEPLPAADFQAPTDWSPDGRFLVYVNTGIPRFANETQSDVWLVDLERDRKLIPLLKTPFHEANPVFSPDGKWLAFTSNQSGRSELYIQAFQPADLPRMAGERYLVSRSGAQAVRWRRDGNELFYLAFDGRVHAVPVRLSPKPAFGGAEPLFTISTEARATIHSVLGFDVSPDGQRFVIPMVAPGDGPSLVVVQNWEAALARRP
jgi:dipeptidyl aminopeptidase/acylaminoacyl peptidase